MTANRERVGWPLARRTVCRTDPPFSAAAEYLQFTCESERWRSRSGPAGRSRSDPAAALHRGDRPICRRRRHARHHAALGQPAGQTDRELCRPSPFPTHSARRHAYRRRRRGDHLCACHAWPSSRPQAATGRLGRWKRSRRRHVGGFLSHRIAVGAALIRHRPSECSRPHRVRYLRSSDHSNREPDGGFRDYTTLRPFSRRRASVPRSYGVVRRARHDDADRRPGAARAAARIQPVSRHRARMFACGRAHECDPL